MKNIAYILLLSIVLCSSCVRDEIEPCPPLTVNITVKDKNYFNVDKVALEERKSEDLAFKEYVPTLYYQLRSAVTGEVVEEQGVFEVTGDGKAFPITFCECIPHGKYVLTTWGGLKDNTPLGDDPTSIEFHLNHAEGKDIYMTNDTLDYDAWNYDYTVEMYREKDVNLAIAKACKKKLETYMGVKVYMTRSSDYFVSLTGRVAYAKKNSADLFVALHNNASTRTNVKGSVFGKDIKGIWTVKDGTYYVTIKYDDEEFKGVFCDMKDEAGTKCMTFSAVGKNKSLWGVKYYK